MEPAKKLLLPEPLKPTMLLCMGLSGPQIVFSRYDLKPWILTYLMYMGATRLRLQKRAWPASTPPHAGHDAGAHACGHG